MEIESDAHQLILTCAVPSTINNVILMKIVMTEDYAAFNLPVGRLVRKTTQHIRVPIHNVHHTELMYYVNDLIKSALQTVTARTESYVVVLTVEQHVITHIVLQSMLIQCVKKNFVQHTVDLDLRSIQTDVKHVFVNKVRVLLLTVNLYQKVSVPGGHSR